MDSSTPSSSFAGSVMASRFSMHMSHWTSIDTLGIRLPSNDRNGSQLRAKLLVIFFGVSMTVSGADGLMVLVWLLVWLLVRLLV